MPISVGPIYQQLRSGGSKAVPRVLQDALRNPVYILDSMLDPAGLTSSTDPLSEHVA